MIVSTTEATDFLEINKSTLTAWKRIGADVAYCGRNRWDLKKLVFWYVENVYAGPVNKDSSSSLQAVKSRYWDAKAARETHRLEVERREVLPKQDVYGEWASRVLEIKAGLLNWKDRLVPMLVGRSPEELRGIIDAETWDLLDQYARQGKYCPPTKEPQRDGGVQ
ncbi:MAG: hypothetical protein AB9866_12885 [Syntrophobacteraceae bacterium]